MPSFSGDELYPSQPDYKGLENPPPKVDLTMEEMNLKHPRANRMAIYSKNRVIPFVTVSEEKMVVPTTTWKIKAGSFSIYIYVG